MSSDQLAVARQYQPASTKRQGGIPQFLDKLYHMVEDPNTDLIKWSDVGDSFVVTDQEKFSKEILGRWFKHQNFGSFVRQLNLYGFRKVPHLQQGALHGDNSEPLCFENTNFHRGQPDLLQLISRKKQAVAGRDEGVVDKPASSGSTTTRALPGTAHMDINSLLGGIAAIKRHQTTISSELTELKRSNQALWQEAITSRERYQRQQDTVDRILKFLGSVFGGASPTGSAQSPASTPQAPGSAGIQRRPKRLLIQGAGDASSHGDKETPRFIEHNSPKLDQEDDMEELDGLSTPLPDTVPHASISSLSSPVTSIVTPFSTKETNPFDDQPVAPPQAAGVTSTPSMPAWNNAALGTEFTDPTSSSAPVTTSGTQSDPMMTSFLANLLNKPNELQKVMNAMQALSPSSTPNGFNFQPSGGDLILAQNGGSLPPIVQQPVFNAPSFANWPPMPDSTVAPFDPQLPVTDLAATNAKGLFQSMANDQQQLQSLDNTTSDLNSHIDAMDSSLHSIMQTFGLPADATYPSHFNPQDHMMDGFDFDLGADSGQHYGVDDTLDWKSILEQMEDSTKGAEQMQPVSAPAMNADAIPPEPVSVPAKRKASTIHDPTATKTPKRSTRRK
ncbi:hypothetical protein BKA62DRAFT_684174 [Auriculariales sp. MPI-PUGE-AT-0066]|nr:hypothetical protein BKA62DRAFT_684174 [Auriculariales sp. MPI-PUGE-AT-0066]